MPDLDPSVSGFPIGLMARTLHEQPTIASRIEPPQAPRWRKSSCVKALGPKSGCEIDFQFWTRASSRVDNIWFIAAFWMGLALLASLISIRLGISVALIEIFVGVIVGNIHFGQYHDLLRTTEWTNFLAMLGSGVLTFLAGAEIDPVSLRANLRASLSIGVLSFLLPFASVWAFAQFVLGWPLHQAQIGGIALSTTSVAVVYAVMIEGGLRGTAMGKTLLA